MFKKLKNKKYLIFIFLVIVIAILIFSYFFFPKNYEIVYNIANYKVIEQYDKKHQSYLIDIINENNKVFKFSFKAKYTLKRKIVTKIEGTDDCIKVDNKFNTYSLCNNNNTLAFNYEYQPSYASQNYENLNIYNLDKRNYYIWNYGYFININDGEIQKVKVFDKDVYTLDLITKYQHYLIMGDYNKEHYFNNFYLINSKNNKISTKKLEFDIYFNSYFLGTYKKYLYLYDVQTEREYRFKPLKKEETELTTYGIYINQKWEPTSALKMNKKDLVFTSDKDYNFILEDNILYYQTLNSKVQVVDFKVKQIIEQFDDEVYFLSENRLYKFNIYTGLNIILQNNEWLYNSKNIYIF